MSEDDNGTSRRSLLRRAGVATGALATSGLAGVAGARGRSRPAACDGATETTTRSGSLSGADDAATLSYNTRTNDPCELSLALRSANATDFDLYVTTDGRTPSTDDYDARSRQSLTSDEMVTLGDSELDANATVGVLVDSYTAGGSWTLELTETATGGGGGNQPPVASFTVSASTVGVGETVEFDATGSEDADGSVSSYEWAFGDGATATGQTAAHAFEAPGSYTVTLTVTDDDGATTDATKEITVESGGGECGVTKTRTETGTLSGDGDADEYAYGARTLEPCEVTLSLTGDAGTDFDIYVTYDGRTPSPSDYDDRAYDYGSDEELVVDGTNVPADGSLGLLVDSYSGSGDYTFTIEEVGTGDDGGDGNQPPIADVTLGDTSVGVGETLSVDGSGSTDPDGSVASHDWTFGDGATASGQTASHSYDSTGEYTVTLTVTDDDGATASTTETVVVESSDGDCGAVSETASTDGTFWYYADGDTYTYETRTGSPCEVTATLDGPSDADFDLYLTTDGRTPTRSDYDASSTGSGADASVTLSAVDASTAVGILVYPASGYGSYQLAIEELGR
ncbi:PKD domain-containing protein [Haloarchaeobius iranensis]|uniref:PKD repeat-containing protein n=1 Tax=Haloarchaeobius iranensis TaxID=996166 RepID=A0A1G9YQ72_9EURY|nr:PKD domain-containing protein [Haloarchaeobius iranensis]SDN10671.1 PKD repeat-containing protein [Haloarchaeobius iranensis]